jgi:hypothetical protein
MNWSTVVRFQVAHERCSSAPTQQWSGVDARSAQGMMTVRCSGCGATLTLKAPDDLDGDRLGAVYEVLAEKLGADPLPLMDTDEGRAQVDAVINAHPALKDIVRAYGIHPRSPQRRPE